MDARTSSPVSQNRMKRSAMERTVRDSAKRTALRARPQKSGRAAGTPHAGRRDFPPPPRACPRAHPRTTRARWAHTGPMPARGMRLPPARKRHGCSPSPGAGRRMRTERFAGTVAGRAGVYAHQGRAARSPQGGCPGAPGAATWGTNASVRGWSGVRRGGVYALSWWLAWPRGGWRLRASVSVGGWFVRPSGEGSGCTRRTDVHRMCPAAHRRRTDRTQPLRTLTTEYLPPSGLRAGHGRRVCNGRTAESIRRPIGSQRT